MLWKQPRAGPPSSPRLARTGSRIRKNSGPLAEFLRIRLRVRKMQERVLILDFGAEYVQLIARRVREQNVFCQIVRHDLPAARVAELKPRGLILSGGPASVYERGAPKCDPALFDLGVPVLGICYGMQLACQALGGEVKPGSSREFGRALCRIHDANNLFTGVPPETVVWMSHGDQVKSAGQDFVS